MFANCFALVRIPTYNTSKVTSVSGTFNTAPSLPEVPALDLPLVTNSTNWVNGCTRLSKSSVTNFKLSHSYASCTLNSAALDAIYTNLPTFTGIITVTGNYGTTADDPAIATAKGWTVTGS